MGQIAPLKSILTELAEEHERRARELERPDATARQRAVAEHERQRAEAARGLAEGLRF